ncbi:hypothetical protein [Adhaeretor mobilis]|uniref:Uncharacterized protein n=1 Tax=Adhaeretor mobilis TaxID=1930276 RepID=A0A517MSM7_9BACT|nr:hypothetical protein [Adhaeretor mobilis]QDS97859.1 hypothetical protein HG15A2_11270 [Adhaeretor mobilis]
MGIAVKCPHGHSFKVKDKYAGKKGLCPYCKGQVFVRVPAAREDHGLEDAVKKAVSSSESVLDSSPAMGDSSIFDDAPKLSSGSSSGSGLSGSLVGSSAVRHNIKCTCGESVPMWFAKCPKCGVFLERL